MAINNVGFNARTQVAIRKIATKIAPTTNLDADPYDDNWQLIPTAGFGLKEAKEMLQSASFNAKLIQLDKKGGNISAAGNITMNLLKEGQEWIYHQALGGEWIDGVTDTASGMTLHTLYPDPDKIPGYFLIERQIKNMAARGYKLFANQQIDTLNINMPQNGVSTVEIGFFGEFVTDLYSTPKQSGTTPELEDDFYVGNRVQIRIFPMNTDGTYESDIAPDFIQGVSLNINNNLIKDGYVFNNTNRDNSVYIAEVGRNTRTVEGSFDLHYTADDDFNTFFREVQAFKVVIELEEDDYMLRYTLPKCKLNDAYDPDITGSDGFTKQSLPFTSVYYADESGKEYEIMVEIVDSIAVYEGVAWDTIMGSA